MITCNPVHQQVKPCPFCKSENIIWRIYSGNQPRHYVITCGDCWPAPKMSPVASAPTAESAIEEWNKMKWLEDLNKYEGDDDDY